MFLTLRLLALEKEIEGIQPIAIGEVVYRLVIHTLAI
jgi:hypothetical protein